MTGLRCSPSLLSLLLSLLLLGSTAAARGVASHTRQSLYPCASVHSRLFGQQLQRSFGQRDCDDCSGRLRSSDPLFSSPRAAASRRLEAPLPPSVEPDAAWLPGQAWAVYAQRGDVYIAWGEGMSNYQPSILRKEGFSSPDRSLNVTFNSTYSIVACWATTPTYSCRVFTGRRAADVGDDVRCGFAAAHGRGHATWRCAAVGV